MSWLEREAVTRISHESLRCQPARCADQTAWKFLQHRRQIVAAIFATHSYADASLQPLSSNDRARSTMLEFVVVVAKKRTRRESSTVRLERSIAKLHREFRRFRADVRVKFAEVGTNFAEVGTHFADVGAHFADVGAHFADVGTQFGLVRAEFVVVRREMSDGFAALRQEIRGEFATRAEMMAGFEAIQQETSKAFAELSLQIVVAFGDVRRDMAAMDERLTTSIDRLRTDVVDLDRRLKS
jgi:hypothetical protein